MTVGTLDSATIALKRTKLAQEETSPIDQITSCALQSIEESAENRQAVDVSKLTGRITSLKLDLRLSADFLRRIIETTCELNSFMEELFFANQEQSKALIQKEVDNLSALLETTPKKNELEESHQTKLEPQESSEELTLNQRVIQFKLSVLKAIADKLEIDLQKASDSPKELSSYVCSLIENFPKNGQSINPDILDTMTFKEGPEELSLEDGKCVLTVANYIKDLMSKLPLENPDRRELIFLSEELDLKTKCVEELEKNETTDYQAVGVLKVKIAALDLIKNQVEEFMGLDTSV